MNDPLPRSPTCEHSSGDQPGAPEVEPLAAWLVPLPRVATMEQWQAGRAGRRKLCEQFNGGRMLRRREGDPRKDAVLRRINGGERGGRFVTTAELEQGSVRALLVRGDTVFSPVPRDAF